MSDLICEYLIKQKCAGWALAKKIIFILVYFLIFAVPTLLSLLSASAEALIPIIMASIALSLMTAFITWRFTDVEFEFLIDSGEMTVSKIYGKRIRKKLLQIKVSDFSEIGLYDDEAFERLSKLSLQSNLICVSSLDTQEMFYGLYSRGDDKCVLYFEATDKAIEIIKRHNFSAFKK